MKVWILSNLHLNCGIAEYGRDLAEQLKKWYTVSLSAGPRVLGELQQANVIIVNWHNSRIAISPQEIKRWQGEGSKVVVILHNSWSGIELGPEETDILAVADAVVAHEQMQFKPNPKKFCYIKHGLPMVLDLPEVKCDSIGTAGFPFRWKRFDLTACVAKQFAATCRMLAPRHDNEETDSYINGIAGHLGHLADIRREFLPKEAVVKTLASCTLNIFWYEASSLSDELGQSGSVLMGVAAGRPMIISKHRKFRVLLEEYADEFYVADTDQDVYRMTREIFSLPEADRKKPKRSRAEMSWERIGERYRDLIEEVVR